MTRTVGSNGVKTGALIREAGIQLLYRHGFKAMSLRDLAKEVGVQPGSLYKYFISKEGLLFDIMIAHMDDLLGRIRQALAPVATPLDRLLAFATFHLGYHRTRHKELHIVNAELRCLSDGPRAEVVALRRQYEEILEQILSDGAREGVFDVHDIRITGFALLAMLTGIGAWYDPKGRVSPEEIVRIHLDLITRGVAASVSSVAAPAITVAA